MKKRAGILSILALLLFMPFILAQEFNPYTQGYDSPFSISLSNFSFQTLLYSDWFFGLIAFLVFFTIYLFILRRFFREVAVILALLLAMASAVGLVMSIGDIFSNISPWFVVIIIAAVIFGLFRNLRNYGRHLSITLLIVAVLWFAIGKQYLCNMTWMPYRACPVIDTICIIIILIAILYGLWYVFWGRRYQQIERPEPRAQEGRFALAISVSGPGNTNPRPGAYQYRPNQNIAVRAQPNGGARFDRWILDGRVMGNPMSLNIIMNDNHTLVAEFSGAGGGQGGGNRQISNTGRGIFRRTFGQKQLTYNSPKLLTYEPDKTREWQAKNKINEIESRYNRLIKDAERKLQNARRENRLPDSIRYVNTINNLKNRKKHELDRI